MKFDAVVHIRFPILNDLASREKILINVGFSVCGRGVLLRTYSQTMYVILARIRPAITRIESFS